jgi:N-acetylated-alpha-linked acidic dipeptidase
VLVLPRRQSFCLSYVGFNSFTMKCLTCALSLATLVAGCVRERDHSDHFHGIEDRLVKRQSAVELTEAESVLLGSIDATDIETWSSYYTHGLHVAGTNESQAQWTADKWAENGFTTSLAQYSE